MDVDVIQTNANMELVLRLTMGLEQVLGGLDCEGPDESCDQQGCGGLNP